ncbi:MAG: DegT/DnrJ/EryC1/StrS family aminotransferase [Acutalibacteraceae bacterium]
MGQKRIPLCNPVPLPPGYRSELEQAVLQVLRSGTYSGGPQVEALELELAAAAGMPYCAGVSNGTDALWLVGAALGIGPGDVVFVPAFTFLATAEAFALLGAAIEFVDVTEETATLCPRSLEQAVARCERQGTGIPKAVIAVDLFGHPADYGALLPFCRDHQLLLVRDGAQSFG